MRLSLLFVAAVGVIFNEGAMAQLNLIPETPPPAPAPSSSITLDASELTHALDSNVQAIANMTASNERMVGTLQGTLNRMVDSNDKNVRDIVSSADRLISEWDTSVQPEINSLGPKIDGMADALQTLKPSLDDLDKLGKDALRTWNSSTKPTVDNALKSLDKLNNLGQDALREWDASINPSVKDVTQLGNDALNKWERSMKPTVDSALRSFDDLIAYIKLIVPLLLGFGTAWAAMCCLSAVFCLVSTGRLSSRKRQMRMLMKMKEGGQQAEAVGTPSLFYDVQMALPFAGVDMKKRQV